MRSEEEIYQLILDVAQKEDRILAVYLEGSRANRNAPRDIFQDYDIAYVVKETKSFIEEKNWIECFGPILYMQRPDDHPFYPSQPKEHYGYLMQFKDGVRIDLTLRTLRNARQEISENQMIKILLDKGPYLDKKTPTSDVDFWVKKPTEPEFLACCNEFWWCTNNVAKALYRQRMLAAFDVTDLILRMELRRLLAWKAGVVMDFKVNIGKSDIYLADVLPKDHKRLLDTYFSNDLDRAWESVLILCQHFRETALWLAQKLSFDYHDEEGQAALAYLERVRRLPLNAKEVE